MILITGPGRSGTTFLVQLLTRLGEDTGYTPYQEAYEPLIRAGCEKRITLDWTRPDEELRAMLAEKPRILKTPEWSFILKPLLDRRLVDLERVILPIRDLEQAAKSRLFTGLPWHAIMHEDGEIQVHDQEAVLALAVGRVVEACVLYDVPLTLMHFPRLIQDAEYCYDQLKGNDMTFGWQHFRAEHERLANPEQVRQW
jgi:hypothetical protein